MVKGAAGTGDCGGLISHKRGREGGRCSPVGWLRGGSSGCSGRNRKNDCCHRKANRGKPEYWRSRFFSVKAAEKRHRQISAKAPAITGVLVVAEGGADPKIQQALGKRLLLVRDFTPTGYGFAWVNNPRAGRETLKGRNWKRERS